MWKTRQDSPASAAAAGPGTHALMVTVSDKHKRGIFTSYTPKEEHLKLIQLCTTKITQFTIRTQTSEYWGAAFISHTVKIHAAVQ